MPKGEVIGPVRESNPGPLAPKARIMPLDQQAGKNQIWSRRGISFIAVIKAGGLTPASRQCHEQTGVTVVLILVALRNIVQV